MKTLAKALLAIGLVVGMASGASAADPAMNRLVTVVERLDARIAALEARMGTAPSAGYMSVPPSGGVRAVNAVNTSYRPQPAVTPTRYQAIPAGYQMARPANYQVVRSTSIETSVDDDEDEAEALCRGQVYYGGYRVVFYVYEK